MHEELPPALRAAAARQGGVITRKQALQAGMSAKAIRCRLAKGAWHPVHTGVYATFTGTLSRTARLWAAFLYAGPGARLSHQTAAEILGLIPRTTGEIHVTVPASRRVRAPEGVAIHLSSFAYPRWRPFPEVPPHTYPAETVIDLVAAAESLDDVVAWVTRGVTKARLTEWHLRQAADVRKKLRWRGELGEIMAAAEGGAHSVLEYRYDRFVVRAHGLPQADKQVRFVKQDGTRGYRDRSYQEYKLLVELDGKQYHPSEQRGEDQDRDNGAIAVGNATLRYGWADVTLRACETAAQLFAALRQRGYTGAVTPCSAACTVGTREAPAEVRGTVGVLRHDREDL